MKSSGASRSTANHDSTSVSVADTGCHWRTEMNGTTVPASSTCGQLCTKLRFGNSVAADTMKPSSATIATCSRRPRRAGPLDHLVGVADVAHALGEVAGRQLVRRAAAGAGEVQRALLALVRLRLPEQPDVDHAAVGVRRVVHVADEVLAADLPVRPHPPALRAAQLEARSGSGGCRSRGSRRSRRGARAATGRRRRGWRRPSRRSCRRAAPAAGGGRRGAARRRRRRRPGGTAGRRGARRCGTTSRGTGSGSATRCRARRGTPACRGAGTC